MIRGEPFAKLGGRIESGGFQSHAALSGYVLAPSPCAHLIFLAIRSPKLVRTMKWLTLP
jgi:hypothetical protein